MRTSFNGTLGCTTRLEGGPLSCEGSRSGREVDQRDWGGVDCPYAIVCKGIFLREIAVHGGKSSQKFLCGGRGKMEQVCEGRTREKESAPHDVEFIVVLNTVTISGVTAC